MKTPKDFLNKVAEEKGFTNFMKAYWEGCLDDIESISIEAMKQYSEYYSQENNKLKNNK